jgi:acetyl esterase/lipase
MLPDRLWIAISQVGLMDQNLLQKLLALGAVLAVADVGQGAGAVAANVAPAPRTALQTYKDLAYYDGPDADPVKHKLDLFLPRDKKNVPVLFFVHGGAWQRGDKAGHFGVYGALGTFLARHGIGVAVVNYRLSPQVQHPEHIKDVARAFAWVHRNIARYGGDPRQIFVGGHSAGGHLAALLATDETYLHAQGLSRKDVRGVVSLSGVYFLPDPYFSNVFGRDPERRRKAWPLEHVQADLPPFLLLCADKDYPGCDKGPAGAFCRALKAKGNQAELIEARDSNHFNILVRVAMPEDPVCQAILGFILAHAKP